MVDLKLAGRDVAPSLVEATPGAADLIRSRNANPSGAPRHNPSTSEVFMFIRDSAAALSREVTPEGFLRLRARIGRTGLHDYTAAELGHPAGFSPGDTVRVFRPPEEVFDPVSMASFAGKPVTDDHPPAMIDAGNWRRYAIGHAGEGVAPEGDHLATTLVIADAAAAARATQGAELSNGYHADFVFEPGTTPDGEPYDAVQRNIRGNHIALVEAGRCGGTCRVGGVGARDGACPPHGTDLAQGAPSPRGEKVRDSGDEGVDRPQDPSSALSGTFSPQAGRRDACGEGGEAGTAPAVPDVAVLDALVRERAGVLDVARRLLGPGFDGAGRPTAAIRRLVVERRLGADAVAGRDDPYLAAVFDTLAALQPRSNPLAAHLSAGRPPASRDTALAARDHDLAHAWKGALSHGDL